jgi:hypothetical protein
MRAVCPTYTVLSIGFTYYTIRKALKKSFKLRHLYCTYKYALLKKSAKLEHFVNQLGSNWCQLADLIPMPSCEYTGESIGKMNNSSKNIRKKSISFLGMFNGTRRSCLMKKKLSKKSSDTVPLTKSFVEVFLKLGWQVYWRFSCKFSSGKLIILTSQKAARGPR